MFLRVIVVLALGSTLTAPFRAAAAPIASAFTIVSEPRICGSVCIPAVTESNNGGVSNGILSSSTVLNGLTAFSEARIDLANGTAGVAVRNNFGQSRADASHTDTWFCGSPATCAALATGGFIPVTLNLHVEGAASLTPSGGFMSLTYVYDAASLLGSSALGLFQFNFFEDPGLGEHADVEGRASFLDYHTGMMYQPTVGIASGSLDNQIAFGVDLTVTSFIGGCTALPCDLTQGVFTDTESLSALIDPASDGTTQGLDSLDTFRVSIASDLPFISADSRTTGVAAAAPEPASWMLIAAAMLINWMRSAHRYKSKISRRIP